MATNLRYRAWVLSRWLIGIFIALFVFRLIYGYSLPDNVEVYEGSGDFFSGVELRKNYASEGVVKDAAGGAGTALFNSSQKYEKTATTRSRSSAFEHDEGRLTSTIKGYKGVIQYEQRSGNPGNRELHLLIGVDPLKFDSFYTAVQSIGRIRSTQVTKVDKTNEYRQLNAKKATLETTLASLIELKNKGGEIKDYISLHEKIREIESELQALGVDLGNFDTENEFCSVRFSLLEGTTEMKISLPERLNAALEWTLEFYAISVACLLGASLLALLIAVLVEKLRAMMSGGASA